MDIYLFGKDWGCTSAYKGLKKNFEHIFVVTDEETFNQCPGAKLNNIDINTLSNCVLVFSGYGPIISEEVLNNNVCINIHPSLLPKYRGVHSTVWAILNDEEYLGITVHLMTGDIDDGPILAQYKVKNDGVRTATSFMIEFNDYIAENLGLIVRDYLDGKIELKPNDKSQATWVGRRHLSDCKIDFNKDIHYQKNFFRALNGRYPLPFFEFKNQRYRVLKVDFHSQNVETHIGRVLNIDNEGMWVKIKDGYMIIKELINEGNEPVPYSFFKRGIFLS